VATRILTTMTFNGTKLTGAALNGATRGVNLAIERLRGHSVERAPIDQGDLRGSATTEHAQPGQAKPTAVLVFDEPYAAVQHQDESLNHTPGAAGEPAGEARYVAKNYEDSGRRKEYRDIIGKAVRDGLGTA